MSRVQQRFVPEIFESMSRLGDQIQGFVNSRPQLATDEFGLLTEDSKTSLVKRFLAQPISGNERVMPNIYKLIKGLNLKTLDFISDLISKLSMHIEAEKNLQLNKV